MPKICFVWARSPVQLVLRQADQQCAVVLQRRGMARIQRTHHPIFAGSLETSTFSPVEGAAAEISAADAAKGPPPQLEPSAEAVTQVNQTYIRNHLPCISLLYAMVRRSASLGC